MATECSSYIQEELKKDVSDMLSVKKGYEQICSTT